MKNILKNFFYILIILFTNFSINSAEIHFYNLSPLSLLKNQFTKIYDFKNFGISEINKNSFLSNNAIVEILKTLGFNYYDKINNEFRLFIFTQHGQLEKIIVTNDGEYAFIIRHSKDFSYSSFEENESLNLLELNPFTGKENFTNQELGGKEIFEGYCRYKINKKTNSASLGPSQTYAIEIPIYKNKGLGSLLLSHALENCFVQGINKFTVFDPTPKAKNFYKQLGFTGDNEFHIELDNYLNLKDLNNALWTTENISKQHSIRNADFRYSNENDEYVYNINIKLLIKKLFNNFLIKKFHEFDTKIPQLRKKPLTLTAYDFMNSNDINWINIILQAEKRGNAYIIQKGKEILREFSDKYKTSHDIASSWKELFNIKTQGEYDFTQLLSHSLTTASGFLQMLSYSKNDKNLLEKFNEYALELWIIFRSIDLESKMTENFIEHRFIGNNTKNLKMSA